MVNNKMKKTISLIIISLFNFSPLQLLTFAQDLYIGSYYVTTTDEEQLYGDGGDKWNTRKTTIFDMIKFEQPDVLGLQSLTSAQLTNMTTGISSYSAAGDILYNNNLTLEDGGSIDEMPDGCTCSWAKLKKGESAFYVFNICFSTENTVASTAASRVRTAIGDINTENLPCFVVGFLGVNETKTAYTRLTVKFNDCFTKAPIVSAEYGTVNNFDIEANHGSNRYDFVLASKTVTVKAYGQLEYAYFTKESDGSYKRRLPSTHFPVMAKVTLPQ